jgi:RNA polymerase sigma-70 factor (ECF subfamily)
MKACQEGSQDAFSELEHRYWRPVWSVCYRILLDRSEAEDVTQQTFLKAWVRRSTFFTGGTFWPWLRAISVTTCLDHLRAVGRGHHVPLDPSLELEWDGEQLRYSIYPMASPAISPEDSIRLEECKRAVESCWSELSTTQRLLLQSIDWSNWHESWRAIVAETAKKAPAVRMAAIRAARALLRRMRQNGFEPTPSEMLTILEDQTQTEDTP